MKMAKENILFIVEDKTRGVECISYMLIGFGFKRYTEKIIKEAKSNDG